MSAVDPAAKSRPATAARAPRRRSASKTTRPTDLPQRLPSETPRRTNSLGWAPSDCHRCAAENWTCDRTRPRCNTCTTHGVVCDGYVLDLNWQQGVASRGRLRGRQLNVDTTSASQQQARSDIAKPAAYLFVYERGQGERSPATKKRSKARTKRKQQPPPPPPPSSSCSPATTATAPNQNESNHDDAVTSSELAGPAASRRHEQGVIATLDSVAISNAPSSSSSASATKLPRPMVALYPVPHQVGELLSFYEWQFARTTITCDVKINPWQCSLPMVYSIHFLMHAVTALSRRHLAHCLNDSEGPEVLILKDRALSSFRCGLPSATPSEALIATAITLIGLEYAETGFSNWTTHLRGAYRILETKNSLDRAVSSSTLRSQIVMLLWWDITTALLSRTGPVFPQRYLDKVLSWSAEYPGEWSNMSLNGCPDSLLRAMYNLAVSAPSADRMRPLDIWKLELCVSGMDAETGVNVNAEPSPPDSAVEVEHDGTSTGNPRSYMTPYLYPSVSVEKPTNAIVQAPTSSDRSANLIKCWRSSMFLYLHQVFYRCNNSTTTAPEEGERQANHRRALSRTIIGLVSEMPTESNWQKQCLLPVVLAGSELRREYVSSVAGADAPPPVGISTASTDAETLSLRHWIKSYCLRWKTLTGLWVFGTAGDLLTRVWDRMDSAVAAPAATNTHFAVPPSSSSSAVAYAHHHPPNVPSQQYGARHAQQVWWGDIVAEDSRANSDPVDLGYLFG